MMEPKKYMIEFCRFTGTSYPLMISWFHTEVTAVMQVAVPIMTYACVGRKPVPLHASYWTMAMAQHWTMTQTHCNACSICPLRRSSSAHRS